MAKDLMPHLEDLNGRKALFVDGKPYIILGLQWDCDTCYSPEDMDPYFDHAVKMGINTASLLLYWRQIEPVEGEYHFDMLDHHLEMARKYNLKLILIWFGSYKNACITYAPDYVRSDHQRFTKVKDRSGKLLTNNCCPNAAETHRRDERALIEVIKHIKEKDSKDHTVILFQMENEVGFFGSDRCYCDTCNAEYARGNWEAEYGPRAAEAYTAQSIAEYCDSLAKTVKEIYPLPVYMNCWLSSPFQNQRGGFNYPSGSPVPAMLELYKQTQKHVDFITPDIYLMGYKDFHYLCKTYSRPDNPLYIPETNTGLDTRTEKNIFYALGEFAAIGYEPWTLNRCCPGFMTVPMVTTVDGRWSETAYDLHKSFKMIGDALYPIVMAQNTENLKFFVQEDCDMGALLSFGDIDVEVQYEHPKNAARGMVIRLGKDEFILAAGGAHVQFSRKGGERVSVATVESGVFKDDQWVSRYQLASEGTPYDRISIYDCRVLRVVLGERIDRPGANNPVNEERNAFAAP
ncbi:beta-galactosidase [Spirochaetia bacterium]|nr:beta-galactosidase [Spirochaetia bacterium]